MRLVETMAVRLARRLPGNIRREDLVQAGVLGLLEVLRERETSRSGDFQAYMRIRINGAMLDEVRRHDWSSRSANKGRREIDRATRSVERRVGRAARDTEIAHEMGTDLASYHALVRKVTEDRVYVMTSVSGQNDDLSESLASCAKSPDTEYESDCLRMAIDREIERLSEKEQRVLSLCFLNELNLREIGELFGLTESRICQIRNGAITRLRDRLKSWRSESPDSEPRGSQSFMSA